jgi:ubiquinone/menaquinone biosynthesis C-methylase UbiE
VALKSAKVNGSESKFVEKKNYLSRYTHERTIALRDSEVLAAAGDERKDRKPSVKGERSKIVPFLAARCGVGFYGRILEIGAGSGWLSAELSKLPRVVEVTAIDLSPRLLKEEAPRMFEMLRAHTAKIIRMPGDFHKLDFANNHFDFVVCSAALGEAVNIVQVIREAKRVLKPGGKLVAVRESVAPLMRRKAASPKGEPAKAPACKSQTYTLSHYKEIFRQAAMPVEAKRVNLSSGMKYYVNKVVNGLTHARYAFIATKKGRS